MPTQAPTRPTSAPSQVPSTANRTTSLIDIIPIRLVLLLAKPYIAGRSQEEALAIAKDIYATKGFAGTMDILGEDAVRSEDCEASVSNYMNLIDSISTDRLKTNDPREQLTVSFKPSMFSTMYPRPGKESERAQEEAFDRITRVVDYAAKRQINITLEAEDHRWTNFQVESYLALIEAGYTNLGTVLQTRLLRTENDLNRFDERMRVRLVIGIYNEPREIALTAKRAMKDMLVRYSAELLRRGTYVELATHDNGAIEQFYRQAIIPARVPANRFEHQFLLGVPRDKVQTGLVNGGYFTALQAKLSRTDAEYAESLAQTGALVRMYLPFGSPAVSGAYCRRRLKENPNMITYGIKNLLRLQS